MTLIAAGIENPLEYSYLQGPLSEYPTTAGFMYADTMSVHSGSSVFTRKRRKIHRLSAHVRVPYEWDRARSRAVKECATEILVGTAGHGLLGNSAVLDFSEALDQIYLVPKGIFEVGWHLGIDNDDAFPISLRWEHEALPKAKFDMDFAAQLLKSVAEQTLHAAMTEVAPAITFSKLFVDFLVLGHCGVKGRLRLFRLHCIETPGSGVPPGFNIEEILPGKIATIGYEPARVQYEASVASRPKQEWFSRHANKCFAALIEGKVFPNQIGGSMYQVIHSGRGIVTSPL